MHLCTLDVVGFVSHFLVGFSYCCAIVRVGSVEEEGRGDGKREPLGVMVRDALLKKISLCLLPIFFSFLGSSWCTLYSSLMLIIICGCVLLVSVLHTHPF